MIGSVALVCLSLQLVLSDSVTLESALGEVYRGRSVAAASEALSWRVSVVPRDWVEQSGNDGKDLLLDLLSLNAVVFAGEVHVAPAASVRRRAVDFSRDEDLRGRRAHGVPVPEGLLSALDVERLCYLLLRPGDHFFVEDGADKLLMWCRPEDALLARGVLDDMRSLAVGAEGGWPTGVARERWQGCPGVGEVHWPSDGRLSTKDAIGALSVVEGQSFIYLPYAVPDRVSLPVESEVDVAQWGGVKLARAISDAGSSWWQFSLSGEGCVAIARRSARPAFAAMYIGPPAALVHHPFKEVVCAFACDYRTMAAELQRLSPLLREGGVDSECVQVGALGGLGVALLRGNSECIKGVAGLLESGDTLGLTLCELSERWLECEFGPE